MSQRSLMTAAEAKKAMGSRLWRAARAYARAYDQVERKSRGADGANVELFARFQEAQVELNLAALDLFAGKASQSAVKAQQPRRRRRK
jgi:hypothetical protein